MERGVVGKAIDPERKGKAIKGEKINKNENGERFRLRTEIFPPKALRNP